MRNYIFGNFFNRLLSTVIVGITMLLLSSTQANGFQLLSPPAQPIDAATSEPIAELLNQYWRRGPANEGKSKQAYDDIQLKPEYTLLAYAVNRIQQNKTREAKAIAETITSQHPDNLDAWMIKTWLNTLEDKYDVALVNMRSFKKRIDSKQNLSLDAQVQIYKRLGRLIGYMQGPVGDRVNRDILDGTITNLTKGASPEAIQTFNDSRDQVLKQHAALLKNQASKTQAELAKVQTENELERARLEASTKNLQQTASGLQPQKQQIQTAASTEISNLEQQGGSIQISLNNISRDIRQIQISLQQMYADLAHVLNNPDHNHGGQQTVFRIQALIRDAERDLSGLRNAGAQLNNDLNVISNRIGGIRNDATRQIRSIDSQLKKINTTLRRNQAKASKLAKGPRIADGKKSSMKNRATALLTYDDLSMEVYRQELLDSLTLN